NLIFFLTSSSPHPPPIPDIINGDQPSVVVTTDALLTIDDRRSRGSKSPSIVATFNEDFLFDLVEVLADTPG
ncbi:hypothetical protein LINPERHAP1_LOCUS2124, partial [Linum perenne]